MNGREKEKLRRTIRREDRYLLRSNLSGDNPAQLCKLCTQVTQVEEAFRNLKGDLCVCPIHHLKEERIKRATLSPSYPTAFRRRYGSY